MYIIISPAKTFSSSQALWQEGAEPLEFHAATKVLINALLKYTQSDLEKLMKISSSIATINEARFRNFFEPQQKGCKAIYAYYGEVYKALKVEELNMKALAFMQEHVGILSALYGLVRPLERIQAYRLEMSTNITIGNNKNLYEFWREVLTDTILKELEAQQKGFLVNLASEEYSKVLDLRRISKQYPIIGISFKEANEAGYRTVGMYAKKARGQMLRFICENEIETLEELKCFSENGYSLNKELSTDKELVFTRGYRG